VVGLSFCPILIGEGGASRPVAKGGDDPQWLEGSRGPSIRYNGSGNSSEKRFR